MDLNEYQRAAMRTAGTLEERGVALANWGLGIAGEAGEVADYVKKVVFHGHALDRDKLRKELGDVLWYVAVLSRAVDLDLLEVAEANIVKLRLRYPDGFDELRSKNRSED